MCPMTTLRQNNSPLENTPVSAVLIFSFLLDFLLLLMLVLFTAGVLEFTWFSVISCQISWDMRRSWFMLQLSQRVLYVLQEAVPIASHG